ncbi:DNA-binding transcriptional response regulator, NtrC family, contains REC, AAA-type ATPase, and a Fis-type DNA-binding domains [Flexibacter flexilis DSM 6793]|uniref:DNA-binding transcriptional response regulator, NtrC family, contains REC, AAA-type ATPase, and a Fis-type DNA-binding domains n=1 Tax=Flexibacter flexilis DSM 6793 TaxID=927664 RepID=A0A1I1L8N4_9BACT|nr:sigma-54 dependent transcriptional regulator [Flexibacter flexilis]SFC66753.1 DNA-binding transcriptional response regulator, NtrC family, contains REC, AAA-type ATPase, and a Fis-type DNA-binding domains [Flexibacter flexilis DSM 6793]
MKIFIVEDDTWYGQMLLYHLGQNPDYELSLFEKAGDLLKALHKHPDLICMDFGLPDMDGEQLLREIKTRAAHVPVIVISAQEEIGVAVNLLKQGAKDYIIKDEYAKDVLWKSVIYLRENLALRQEVEVLREELSAKYDFTKTIIGQSEAIQRTFGLLRKAIQSSINVSLTGETGTGKEVYAKAIHFNGDRRKKPFVAVNMAAIPKELAESELFGYEKGAFTGAMNAKAGKFEEADGGTLFLDEIGEMDLNLQSKLLRVLQEREVVRIGGSKPKKIDIRLITATHKNLADEVKKGNFREDLFFRLVGLPIELPPLRNRQNDVLLLAKHFMDEYTSQNKQKPLKLSDTAKTKLKKHLWGGNVRELKAVMDLACVMCDNGEITAEDITFYELGGTKPYSESEKTLRDYELEIIQSYLDRYEGNALLVAEKLDIGKSKIYNLISAGELKNK